MPVAKRSAETATPIHELLANRWSPRAFERRAVEPEKLRSMFEAARWAASSFNAQPWFFIVATKDDPENFNRVLDTFVEFNRGWAKDAPVVALSVTRHKFEHNGEVNRHAFHDVGQAAANLAIEAVAEGLQLHQMAGILVDKAREVLAIPEGYDPVAGFALGYPGDPQSLSDRLRERELAPRQRKESVTFVHDGTWDKKASFLT